MKKNRKYVLTDTILKEIAREAENQLIDEMMEREDALEHTWTKGWDDVLKRAAARSAKENAAMEAPTET